MITVMVEIKMKSEHLDEFREFMKTGVQHARDFEGCELVEAFEDEDNTGAFLFREIWTDRAAQERFAVAGHESGEFAFLTEWMASPPVIRYLNGLDV
jgi:quinol monooxygenase YgiN